MKTKKKRRKRIGISLLILAASLVPVASAAKKKPPEVYAVISGSVFQESGYALPDADVSLVPEEQSDKASKPMTAVTDARGEFVFHVPPGPAHYAVTVDARGYQRQRKSVSVQDQERVEVTFQMEHQSK